MNEFNSILEAIEPLRTCPVCNQDILVDVNYLLAQVRPCRVMSYNTYAVVGYPVSCDHCLKYSYTLKIDFMSDGDGVLMNKVSLNSESVYIEDNNVLYEIRNAYALNKTEAVIFLNNHDGEKISFPLLSNNMKDYKKLVNKVKKFIIFS